MNMFEKCQEVSRWMAAFEGKWFIAGGWAIDLHIGEETRQHEDIEVAVFRDDQSLLQETITGWEVQIVENEQMREWNQIERLELPVHEIHAKRNVQELEILLNERDGERWVYRREPEITFPISHMHLHSEQGFPYLNPEIVLLYKAKETSQKDHQDFENIFPRLNERQKEWLKQGLIQYHPNHPWLEKLLL